MRLSELNQLLAGTAIIQENKILNYTFSVKNLSFLKLRDILIELGKICYEDTEKQVYIVNINGGFFKKNPAMVALHLSKDMLSLAIHADEGIINQHTCEGVINELKNALKGYIKRDKES